MDVYFIGLTNFPQKVFTVNPEVKKDFKYVYFVVASDKEEAEELALYLFKEQFGLYTGCYEISLYLKEITCETYKCPTEFAGFDTDKYRSTLSKASRVGTNIYNYVPRL